MFNTGTEIARGAGVLLLAALVACTPTQPQLGNSTPSTKSKKVAKPPARHRPETGQPSSAWKRAAPGAARQPLAVAAVTATVTARAATVTARAAASTAPALAVSPPAAPAPVDAPAKKTNPQAASQPDWTRLFKAWENGCANSPEFDAFEKNFALFGRQRAGQQAQIQLPDAFKAATGAPTSRYRPDYSSAILPVMAGSYYGIALKSIEFYSGHENGIRGKQILLDAPETVVKKILRQKKVVFKKGKTHRAVVSGTATHTAVTCDASD